MASVTIILSMLQASDNKFVPINVAETLEFQYDIHNCPVLQKLTFGLLMTLIII